MLWLESPWGIKQHLNLDNQLTNHEKRYLVEITRAEKYPNWKSLRLEIFVRRWYFKKENNENVVRSNFYFVYCNLFYILTFVFLLLIFLWAQFWDARCPKANRSVYGVFVCGEGLSFDRRGKELMVASWRPWRNLQFLDYSTGSILAEAEPELQPHYLTSGEYFTR